MKKKNNKTNNSSSGPSPRNRSEWFFPGKSWRARGVRLAPGSHSMKYFEKYLKMAGPSKSLTWVLKKLVNGRSIDGRNFTLEKMARSLFGEDICWAFHSSSLLCDIFKTLLLLCITCCTNINRRAFIRIFSSDPEIFESPCCHIENILLQCWAQHHIDGGGINQAGWMVDKTKKLNNAAPMLWFGCLLVIDTHYGGGTTKTSSLLNRSKKVIILGLLTILFLLNRIRS